MARHNLELDETFAEYVTEIRLILCSLDAKRGQMVAKTDADAIRYAISFCHKQLTEVLNPEDLRDD